MTTTEHLSKIRVNGAGGEPNLGHCQIFDNLKWYYEGKNCTAFSKPNIPKMSHD